MSHNKKPSSVAEYEREAASLLPVSGFKAHLGSIGEPTWSTNSNNVAAFARWVIRPRILTGVSRPSLATTVLDQTITMPVIIAPWGGQQRFHPQGELAVARAAVQTGTIMTLSTMATYDIEETRDAAPNAQLWFQLYVMRNRALSEGLVRRAEDAGYRAIMLTVDNISGHLKRTARNRHAGIDSPEDIHWPALDPQRVLANFRAYRGTPEMPPPSLGDMFDVNFTWSDLAWLRSLTQLPIILKGVQTPEDAELAVSHGVEAIVVSNHGGTPAAMDGLGATLQSLIDVVAAVKGRLETYLDGGVRQGSDVFKALALGARAVLVGRAPLWGLAVAGECGVADVISLLREELESSMCIGGVADVSQIGPSAVALNPYPDAVTPWCLQSSLLHRRDA